MNRYVVITLALSLSLSASLINTEQAFAQHEREQRGGGGAQHSQQQPAAQAVQQSSQQRQQQLQQQQEALAARQQQARQQQEQTVRNQEIQARQAQQAAKAQEQAAKAQEQAARNEQSSELQNQQRQERQQAQAAPNQQRQQERTQGQNQQQQVVGQAGRNETRNQSENSNAQNYSERGNETDRRDVAFSAAPFAPGVVRPYQPSPISFRTMPLEKAILMPFLDPSCTPEERDHAAEVEQCLRDHLSALLGAPADFAAVQANAVNALLNNYQTNIMGTMITFTPTDNTVEALPPYENPPWVQQEPGYYYSQFFTLGGSLRVGMDWLNWGWHPYYGPAPNGYMVSLDYVATPYFYFPAYGLWRVAGVPGWAPAAPPPSYTGPITVVMLEHRKITSVDPYTHRSQSTVINMPYLYNAFYFAEYGRWGYKNRHGNFLLLNA